MKKKFLILTLCFTIIFSSINYKKSYADAGVISLPVLATVATLAVGTGMALNDIDDLYDIGNIFYNKNKEIWNTVLTTFNACVSFNKTIGKLSVGRDFIDIFRNTFSDYKDTTGDEYSYSASLHSMFDGINPYKFTSSNKLVYRLGDNDVELSLYSSGRYCYFDMVRIKGGNMSSSSMLGQTYNNSSCYISVFGNSIALNGADILNRTIDIGETLIKWGFDLVSLLGTVSLPYLGGYDDSKLGEGDKDISLPSNLGDLVGGKVSSDSILGDSVMSGASNGEVSLPTTSNPSISVDTSIAFPMTGTVEGDIPNVDAPTKPTLPPLPSWGSGLDFSPITQGVFTDKFPFCLAKDVKDIISVFDVPSRNLKEPVFQVPFLGEELVLDFREFKLWFDIVKFFVLIGFIISLIVLTRGIIG